VPFFKFLNLSFIHHHKLTFYILFYFIFTHHCFVSIYLEITRLSMVLMRNRLIFNLKSEKMLVYKAIIHPNLLIIGRTCLNILLSSFFLFFIVLLPYLEVYCNYNLFFLLYFNLFYEVIFLYLLMLFLAIKSYLTVF
jgi:hypothetical protein